LPRQYSWAGVFLFVKQLDERRCDKSIAELHEQITLSLGNFIPDAGP